MTAPERQAKAGRQPLAISCLGQPTKGQHLAATGGLFRVPNPPPSPGQVPLSLTEEAVVLKASG